MAKAPQRKTLVGILGASAAIGAVVNIAREESGRTVTATVAPAGNIEIHHIKGRQYLAAYRDTVKVVTACDGLTRDLEGRKLVIGQRFTEAQCTAMLEASLIDTADHVMRCTPGLAGAGHDNQRLATMLLAHNIGWPNYCGSTARARFNARQYAAACDAFLNWRFAGGRPILLERRKRERTLCYRDVYSIVVVAAG